MKQQLNKDARIYPNTFLPLTKLYYFPSNMSRYYTKVYSKNIATANASIIISQI